jgi:crotonobetainyl-CoA:carnitine CoA-transferase CaiB-like acyl-CoA transferase
MVVELKHPGGKSTRGPGNPIKLSRTNEESFSAAPLVGQHTNQVLSRLLGYEAQAIEELRRQGVVG